MRKIKDMRGFVKGIKTNVDREGIEHEFNRFFSSKKNIVLVGFMGAGKTLVAQRLAEILKRPCVSTDRVIEDKEKCSIVEIFKASGEEYFRGLEKEIVKELSQKENLIIDCGGGAVLQQENIDRLKEKGILIYLFCDPDVIYQRTKNKRQRPLLNVPDSRIKIQELLDQRKSYYEQAHFTIDTSRLSADQSAQKILALLP